MRKRLLLMVVALFAVMTSALSAQAIKVYFNNPNNWTTVKAYFSDATAAWPGTTTLTKAAGETLWSCDVPAAEVNNAVIFNNGSGGDNNQFPGYGSSLPLAGKSMILQLDKDHSSYVWTEYEDEAFTVYFDNSFANWSNVYIHYWGKEGSTWESCPAMTKVEGTSYYSYQVPAGTAGILFKNATGNVTNENTDKTANFAAKKNHKYSKTADLGEYTASSGNTQTAATVYFDNKGTGWSTPTIHYWGGVTTATYPGDAMTHVSGNIYSYVLPLNTTGILFNGGGTTTEADGTKTANMVPVDGHIYTTSGDQGEYASYTPNVDIPATLFLLTNNGVNPMDPSVATAMTRLEGTNKYTVSDVKIDVATVGGEFGYFTFLTKKGNNSTDWTTANSGDRYGAATEDASLTDGVGTVVKYAGAQAGSAKSWKVAPGTYTFTVDFEALTVTVSGSALMAGTGTVNIPGVTVQAGSDSSLAVNLTTDSNIVGLQLDILLPSVVMASAPTIAPGMGDGFNIMGNSVNGKYRILISSDDNKNFPVKNGTIFNLPFTALSSAAPGEYNITVSDIILSDANLLKATLEPGTIGKITVTEGAAFTVTLDPTEMALKVGQTGTLTLKDGDENTLTDGVVWTSSNPAVATVNAGTVTAVANGTAVITAAYGSAKATCNVTVGKDPQTITWDQDFEAPYPVGAEITFTATSPTATVANPIVYTIVSGSAYATLDGDKLTTTAPGIVIVQASLAGTDTYAPANPVKRTITVWLGYKPGDVNGDDSYTAADVTSTINYILGKNPTPFNATAADVNGDNSIDIVDVTLIVDFVKKQAPANGSSAPARAQGEDMESFHITGSGYAYHVSFTNMQKYVATQFDLILPTGVEISGASMAGSSHKVSFGHVEGNIHRVIAYSEQNDTFASNGFVNLTFNKAVDNDFTLNNALVDRVDGDDIIETSAMGTSSGLTGVAALEAENGICSVYTIDGICVFRGSLDEFRAEGMKGVYMIRTANKVQKVVLK